MNSQSGWRNLNSHSTGMQQKDLFETVSFAHNSSSPSCSCCGFPKARACLQTPLIWVIRWLWPMADGQKWHWKFQEETLRSCSVHLSPRAPGPCREKSVPSQVTPPRECRCKSPTSPNPWSEAIPSQGMQTLQTHKDKIIVKKKKLVR